MAETARSFASWLQGAIEGCLSALRWVGHQLLHHLPAALVVASLVTIGHHQFHLLDAIDSYAFLAIGNRSAFGSPGKKVQAAVVSISPDTNESHYRERSPLDRCQLLEDLRALYHGRNTPEVMVIDLDLSPSPILRNIPVRQWTHERLLNETQEEALCEEQLYKLFENKQCATKTILMEPFRARSGTARSRTFEWQERMKKAEVEFGNPALAIRYGLIAKIPCHEKGLAASAFQAFSPGHDISCLSDASGQLLISPRQYRALLPITDVANILGRHPWLKADDQNITIPPQPYEKPVVFFGASYGETDLYLTPVGQLYGVEIHAAAFLSLLEPASDFSHLLAFLLEVAIGLVFGMVISFCWHWYYQLRFSSGQRKRRLAPTLVLLLGALFCLLVAAVTLGSYRLLSHSDLWLSPIPIALGMLIESFFTGAVHGAVKEGLQLRQELATELRQAFAGGPEQLNAAFDREDRRHHAHHPHHGWNFLGLEALTSFREDWPAAALQMLGRVTFFGLLIWALLILLHIL